MGGCYVSEVHALCVVFVIYIWVWVLPHLCAWLSDRLIKEGGRQGPPVGNELPLHVHELILVCVWGGRAEQALRVCGVLPLQCRGGPEVMGEDLVCTGHQG